MERALVEILEDDAPVSAIVSDRIYPNVAPQGKQVPYIVYSRINTEPSDTKSGTSKLDRVAVDLDFFGNNYKTLRDLADKSRTALDRFSGTKQSQVIDKIVFTDQRSTFDNDAQLYHITQSYNVRQKI